MEKATCQAARGRTGAMKGKCTTVRALLYTLFHLTDFTVLRKGFVQALRVKPSG